GGMINCSITTGGWSIPNMRGMEKPQMSASMTPTDEPARASDTARLVVTDDLPTPPLTEETAMTRVREPDSPTAGPAAARRSAIIDSRRESSITSPPMSIFEPAVAAAATTFDFKVSRYG